jgi:hypothetical protein
MPSTKNKNRQKSSRGGLAAEHGWTILHAFVRRALRMSNIRSFSSIVTALQQVVEPTNTKPAVTVGFDQDAVSRIILRMAVILG